MPFVEVHYFSDVLNIDVTVNVLLPNRDEGETCRTLLLLHGLSDDHSTWMRRTSIERYAEGHNLAVIMPCGDRCYYTDTKTGRRFGEFIFREVPETCRSMFRQMTDKREHNFIAGLSMGGYGAIKGALLYPERYAAAACFSAHVDHGKRFKLRPDNPFLCNIFGSPMEFEGSENDIRFLARDRAEKGVKLPSVYIACGTEDDILDDSHMLRDVLTENGYDVTYFEGPGNHTWEFWDTEVQKAIKFFDKLPK